MKIAIQVRLSPLRVVSSLNVSTLIPRSARLPNSFDGAEPDPLYCTNKQVSHPELAQNDYS